MRRRLDNGPRVGGRERGRERGRREAPRGGSGPGGRGSQGPLGAPVPGSPRLGDRSAISCLVSESSATRVPPRRPDACPRAQGDPPSSWPCPSLRALCLHSPGSEGSVPCPGVAPSSFFRPPCQTQAACLGHPFPAPVAPRVLGAYPWGGVPRTPASGAQRFSSGASKAPLSSSQVR